MLLIFSKIFVRKLSYIYLFLPPFLFPSLPPSICPAKKREEINLKRNLLHYGDIMEVNVFWALGNLRYQPDIKSI